MSKPLQMMISTPAEAARTSLQQEDYMLKAELLSWTFRDTNTSVEDQVDIYASTNLKKVLYSSRTTSTENNACLSNDAAYYYSITVQSTINDIKLKCAIDKHAAEAWTPSAAFHQVGWYACGFIEKYSDTECKVSKRSRVRNLHSSAK